VVIALETNKKNTNVDHISNEKHIYLRLNSKKSLVSTILCEMGRMAKNAFSARQNAFLVQQQNLLTH
jgi:hypothetical protein